MVRVVGVTPFIKRFSHVFYYQVYSLVLYKVAGKSNCIAARLTL